jgi:class 3 adenylate cyclase
MDPQIQYVRTSDGVNIAYWSMGSGGLPLIMGSPLVFSHLTREWEMPQLREWYLHLAESRQLVRFDFRNMGLSQRGVPADQVLSGITLDVQAVADRLELPRFALYGGGGATFGTVTTALELRARVARLVISNPQDRPSRVWEHPAMHGILALAETNWHLFTETMAQALYGWGRRAGHDWARYIRASLAQEDFNAQEYINLDVTPLLPEIQMPTLLLHYKRFPTVSSEILASTIPHARLYLHEQPLQLDEPAKSIMEEFLAEGDTPSVVAGPSGTAVILFADIVDSTALTERMGDTAFRDASRALDQQIRAAIRDNDGTPVGGKVLGDGVMGTFASAREAIAAAVRCSALSAASELGLHIGLHAGDVIREDDNVYGGTVNIASRICGLSAPGEILVSDVVRGMARSSAGVQFEDRGEQEMKGVGEPVRVFAIRTIS